MKERVWRDTGNWIQHSFQEVMDGDWIITNDWTGDGVECSACGRIFEKNKIVFPWKYCSSCGAKMN